MEADSGIPMKALKVDGGASANNYLMQTMADISNVPYSAPAVWKPPPWGPPIWRAGRRVLELHGGCGAELDGGPDLYPRHREEERTRRIKGWNKAVRCAYNWAKDDD